MRIWRFGGSCCSRSRQNREQTLGIFGVGRIGEELAGMATPLVKRVVVFDPWILSTSEIEQSWRPFSRLVLY